MTTLRLGERQRNSDLGEREGESRDVWDRAREYGVGGGGELPQVNKYTDLRRYGMGLRSVGNHRDTMTEIKGRRKTGMLYSSLSHVVLLWFTSQN